MILSIPRPDSAAFKCSTVEMRTPCSLINAVQSIVSRTELGSAGNATAGFKSVR